MAYGKGLKAFWHWPNKNQVTDVQSTADAWLGDGCRDFCGTTASQHHQRTAMTQDNPDWLSTLARLSKRILEEDIAAVDESAVWLDLMWLTVARNKIIKVIISKYF